MSQLPPSLINHRQELREILKALRESISGSRREEAEHLALQSLGHLLPKQGYVLSYASFSSEFPTERINEALAKEGRLVLPKVVKQGLDLYQVDRPAEDLENSPWSMLEPIPHQEKKVAPQNLAFVLVPGLGFDRNWHRIGYGKGYYDRFLASIPQCPAYGLGFKEQLVSHDLPIAPHDLQLSGLLLY